MKGLRDPQEHVLLVVALGLISILLGIIIGIFTSPRALPNWAENVLVSIGTAAVLKLGDCLATLVQLVTGRSTERMAAQLSVSTPVSAAPQDVTVVNKADDPIPVETSDVDPNR